MSIAVRKTRPEDFEGLRALCLAVYPDVAPYSDAQLQSHVNVFPGGQLTALDEDTGEVVGMAASLILSWDDYDMDQGWKDFTAGGYFTNHDPSGRTLYGAEVMVGPGMQGRGVGSQLYEARRELCGALGLLRIRAGARLRGYHRYADALTPTEYVRGVARDELHDPTLSFQLHRGFRVIAVVDDYLGLDPESRGKAAVIEWLNPEVATPEDHARSRGRFPLGPPGNGGSKRSA